ncbi:MAG: SoxR reducing system RseC family protein [Candidatus Thiodiazotropha sp.]
MTEGMSDSSTMLAETARVIDVKDGMLLAETESRSGCNHCSADNCTTSVVAKLFGVKRNRLVLENSLGAEPGDRVVIGIPDALLVRASILAYLLPLLSMLGMTAIGKMIGLPTIWLSMLALFGLAMGFFMVNRATRGWTSQRYKPQLMRIEAAPYQRVEVPILTRS